MGSDARANSDPRVADPITRSHCDWRTSVLCLPRCLISDLTRVCPPPSPQLVAFDSACRCRVLRLHSLRRNPDVFLTFAHLQQSAELTRKVELFRARGVAFAERRMDTCGKISRSCALASLPSTRHAPYALRSSSTIPNTGQNNLEQRRPETIIATSRKHQRSHAHIFRQRLPNRTAAPVKSRGRDLKHVTFAGPRFLCAARFAIGSARVSSYLFLFFRLFYLSFTSSYSYAVDHA